MKHHVVALASLLAFAGPLTSAAVSQPTSPSPNYPNWTGAPYPFAQHLTIMLLHMDDAALAMARTAQQKAKDPNVKRIAADVIADRSREAAALNSAYAKRYGQNAPAWPTPQTGTGSYGPGMMGSGYGPGMMGGGYGRGGSRYGPGMMGGGYGAGMMGPMMGYGDGYQTMMDWRSNWWGSSSVDTGFVPALLRLDAMEVSMASLALTSNDASENDLVRGVLATRAAELARLAKTVQ